MVDKKNDFGSLIKKEFPKSSENIFRGFIGQSSEGISLINQKGIIIDCNEAMLHIYEVEKENIIGKHIWDFEPQFFIHEKQKTEYLNKIYRIQKEYLKHIKDQKPKSIETEIVTQTKVKYINLLIFPILTENACFVGRIISDITEKKEKEIELRSYQNQLEHIVEERTGELKLSEEKFRLLFEKSHDPILIIDEYKFVECNEATVNILGFSSKDDIYKIHPSEISPKYQPDGRLSYEKAQELMNLTYKYGYNRFEWVHMNARGKEIIMDIALTKIPYKGRQMIFTMWRDITRQKQYEKSLRQSQERFTTLFEQAADGILVGINDGEIIEANESICKLTGYTKSELIGKNIKLLFTKDILSKKPLRYDLVKKGETVVSERELVRKDGTIVQTEMNTKILDDGRMQALFRDVTKRKQVELALIESEAKYRNIFYSSPLGIFHYDINGVITDCNDNFVKIIGSNRDILVGLNMITQLKDTKMINCVKESLIKGEAYYEDLYKSVTADKSNYVRVLFNGIRNKENQIISGLGIVEDITERKQLEQRIFDVMIETEEKERQRLASDIHDEVGPLLSSLKMYIEMLNEKSGKQEFIKSKLQELIKETIVNIREVSNDLSPNLLINYGLISAVKSFINTQKEIIKIDLHTNLTKERFGIKIETVFYRILKELTNNTIKHANATEITIKMEYINQKLILNYRDNGIGMKPQKVISSKTKGLGLGNIDNRVKTINGTYEIISDKNKGFQFILTKEV